MPIGLRTTFAWKLVAVAVLVSAAYLVVPASHAESIKIGALEGSANSIPVELILREAYNQLGIDLEVSYFPARRSLQLANKGQFDGELQRVDGLDKTYTNLIKVPIKVGAFGGMAFTTGLRFRVNGWHSLKDFRIGIVRSVAFVEKGTQELNTVSARNSENLFRMLKKGRFDVAVVSEPSGKCAIERSNIDGVTMLPTPIEEFPLFHYLHVRNEDLVPMILAELRQMTDEGRIDEIWRTHLNSLDCN